MFSPSLEIGADGTTVLAWERIVPGTTDTVVQGAARAPGGGAFSSPQNLSSETNEARAPDVAVSPLGLSMVVWQGGGTSVIKVSLRPPGGPFVPPADLSAPGSDALFPRVALSRTGDAAVIWRRYNGANEIVQAAGYDANPPEARSLSLPAAATVGEPVPVSFEPFDVWPLSSTLLDFGDGASASAASASHAYGSPGTYRVTASVSDRTGTSGSAAAEITILASNDFRLGKLKRNMRRGTASLVVQVPGPGGVLLFGRGVKRVAKRAGRAGTVRLPVRAAGKAAKQLRRRGKARLRLRVRFSPDGGPAAERRRAVVLKKKRKKRPRRRR
jgi:hypothetical protein